MFSIFSSNKKLVESGLLAGMTDVHCHLLPGVDDGISSEEDAREAIRFFESMGVERMFLTPHMMADYPDNRPAFLKERLEKFRKNCTTHIEFRLAGEYMLDTGFHKHLEEGMLTLGDKYVLVETSYMSGPPDIDSMLYELMVSGYQPILAHPERYLYMGMDELAVMKKKGCKFQLNLMSLSDGYGRRVTRMAHDLLKEGMYDFTGSDFHRLSFYERTLAGVKLNRKQMEALKVLLHNNSLL